MSGSSRVAVTARPFTSRDTDCATARLPVWNSSYLPRYTPLGPVTTRTRNTRVRTSGQSSAGGGGMFRRISMPSTKRTSLCFLVLAGLALTAGPAGAAEPQRPDSEAGFDVTQGWPEASRVAAEAMRAKYG